MNTLNARSHPNEVFLTDVTLRDGQQQRTEALSIQERLEVFKQLVETGVDRIEIGHLGNSKGDQQLAREIIAEIAKNRKYYEDKDIKIQVLFGSQENIIEQGINVLVESYKQAYGDSWKEKMADEVVVHVYDRLDENLRKLSSDYYTAEQSAERVITASMIAIDAGFRHFSISGEATSAVTVDEAIKFYDTINEYLIQNGAESVNDNFANTYGFARHGRWGYNNLKKFNDRLKKRDQKISTSMHSHNDTNGGTDISILSLVAGFDRVETTHIGMGERSGNVPAVDLIVRLLEQAQHFHDSDESKTSAEIERARCIKLGHNIIEALDRWHQTGEYLAITFGKEADYRWHRTPIGNEFVFDNGSGPHDQAMATAISDPFANPPYRNYEWLLTIASLMGHPKADDLAIGEPEAVKSVTVGNFAGGGSTDRIKSGELKRADDETAQKAKQQFNRYKREIAKTALEGFVVID